MRKFAVIDIGSNSVRLMFVADGKVLYKRLNTTRLGEGIAQVPRLKQEAIERSAKAVAEFYAQAKAEDAEAVYAFATAAVRAAENGADFVQAVKQLCGLTVEVISGEEEAEIGILGALGNADGGVIDVGGASTEVVIKKGGEMSYKKSIGIGVVRLKDMCGRERSALEETCKAKIAEFGNLPEVSNLWAIGGTATTLAAQVLGLQTYDSAKITGAIITQSQMSALADKLLEMSVEEIAALPCMPKGRADVLTGGAVLLATVMKQFNIQTLTASDRDNLEGYAVKHGYMQ